MENQTLADKLAQFHSENIDVGELIEHYYQTQRDYFNDMSVGQLAEYMVDNDIDMDDLK